MINSIDQELMTYLEKAGFKEYGIIPYQFWTLISGEEKLSEAFILEYYRLLNLDIVLSRGDLSISDATRIYLKFVKPEMAPWGTYYIWGSSSCATFGT